MLQNKTRERNENVKGVTSIFDLEELINRKCTPITTSDESKMRTAVIIPFFPNLIKYRISQYNPDMTNKYT